VGRDDIPGAHTEEVSSARPKQADLLIKLAEACDLYHAPDGTSFADVAVKDHRETWSTRSKGFRRWLVRRYYEATHGAPSSEAVNSALAIIEAKAQFDGAERTVHVRVAGLGDRLFIDLADSEWRSVEIKAQGWRIIDRPPVRFRRATGMLPLPSPAEGGALGELRRLINVQDDRDVVLIIAWLLAALRNRGPYPVLELVGEQGSAKSFHAAMLRALVDPNTVALRAPPRDDRDLYIAATNGHVIALDNLSSMPPWLSDALCRLSTGGGFATRQLYSDTEEVLLDAMRPIILTAIEDVVTRGDLADRSMQMRLAPIIEERRRPEREIWADFETARPRILGALLDAVAVGLRDLGKTRLDRLPRMADFAVWTTACEGALWRRGTFAAAYCANRVEMDETVIEADTVATAVRSLVAECSTWTGTAQELLAALVAILGEPAAKAKAWPTTPRALSGRLRRAAPTLRRVGISIVFGKRRSKERPITIKAEQGAIRASQPSSPSLWEGLGGFPGGSRGAGDDRRGAGTVLENLSEFAADDSRDGRDGVSSLFSGAAAPAPGCPKHKRITL